MRLWNAVTTATCALVLIVPAVAQAATTQTFTTSQSEFTGGVRNQGWWSSSTANRDFNDNYLVGQPPDAGGARYRNFFTFDLSNACAASAVSLRLTRYVQSGPVTYSLFDVSTPAATLNANNGTNEGIFEDLGTGVSFGSFSVAPGGADDVVTFRLNVAGVSAFNAARGGFFSVGGSLGSQEATFGNFLYGFSFGAGTQELSVTCLPRSKEECKDGGWRSFGVFKNQGDCVSFVTTGGRNQPAKPPA